MAFGWFKSVTIDHTQCGGADSSNFPVVIWVTDADLKTVGNGGKVTSSLGYDIRPYADSGASTPLTFELVPGIYNPATGQLEMWVKIPTVSHTSDTVFYLFFGDSGITTDGSSTAVWDANTIGVWHYYEETGSVVHDSTANGNDLTWTGSAPTAHWHLGLIGGCGDTLGATANFGDPKGSPTSLIVPSGDYTIQGWMFVRSTDTRPGNWAVGGQWSGGTGYMFYVGVGSLSSGSFTETFSVYADGNNFTTSVTYTADAWHQFAATKSGSTGSVYVDGSLVASGSIGGSTFASGGVKYEIAAYSDSAAVPADALLDESHVSKTVRSADWILQEYNNQKVLSTFLTFGALTPVSGFTEVWRMSLLGVG